MREAHVVTQPQLGTEKVVMVGRGFVVLFLAAFMFACNNDSDHSNTATSPVSQEALPDIYPTIGHDRPAMPRPVSRDIRATRLTVPRLNIDAPVLTSHVIPYTYTPPSGCGPRPQDTSTYSVPEQGIATPVERVEGLENKALIYGHSRWLGSPGTFFALQDMVIGDELFIDGVDWESGSHLEGVKFLVHDLYLADMDSGGRLIYAEGPEGMQAEPFVILQTSVREDGLGKQWIFDRGKVLAKAMNVVEGNLDDPCKYLLLFAFAVAR